jgi:HPt (histidine-containing phosphotransfer) domain-containing protein
MPLYHRSLGLFVAHHGDDPKHLPRLAQAQDLHGLKQLAHSLVGAAATLGAEPVRALAQQLEHTLDQALLAGAPAPAPGQPAWPARVGPLAEALQALLDALHEALRAASGSDTAGAHTAGAVDSSNHTANSTRTNTDAPTGPAAAPARTDPDAVRALLQRLQQLQPLLHSHDTAAGERVDAAQALLATHLGPLAQQLAAQIHSFSFEDAQQTMALALQRAHALAAEAVWTPSGSGPAP